MYRRTGATEMAQGFKALTALLGGPTAPCNSLSRESDVLFWSLWAPGTHVVCIHTNRQNIPTHEMNHLKHVEESCLFVGEKAERKLSTDTLRVATVSPSFTGGSVGQLCFCCQVLSHVLGEVLAAFGPLYHYIRSSSPPSQANFGNQTC